MSVNPYKSPVSHAKKLPVEPVTRWRRFTNFAIDYFLIAIVWFVILIFVESLWHGLRHYDFRTEDPPVFPPPYDKNISAAIATIIGASVASLYFTLSEWMLGKTIGKLVTGTIVVNELGQPPTFKQMLKRTALRFLPWDCITYLSGSKTGWHDRFSGTTVVRRKSLTSE